METIEEQRDRLEEAFVHGWVTPARGPVTFNEEQLTRLDHVSQHGGWTNKDESEYLRRLRAGGRRGDPLPAAPAAREPYIDGLGEDFEFQISTQAEQEVVVLFSHERWPGIASATDSRRRARLTDTKPSGSRKKSRPGL